MQVGALVMGSYVVELRVHSYHNPSGRCDQCGEASRTNPWCCDETSPTSPDRLCPNDSCDTLMVISESVGGGPYQLLPGGGQLKLNTNSIELSPEDHTFFKYQNPIVRLHKSAWMVSLDMHIDQLLVVTGVRMQQVCLQ